MLQCVVAVVVASIVGVHHSWHGVVAGSECVGSGGG